MEKPNSEILFILSDIESQIRSLRSDLTSYQDKVRKALLEPEDSQ